MVYGIDFGTTNSAVVSYDERTRKLRTVGDEADNNPIPSVIAVRTFNNEISVGRKVKNNMLSLIDDGRHLVFTSVKSFLDQDIVRETDDRTWNAEEIATELFRALATRVIEAGLPPMKKAVVAIPIGMNSEKRAVLRRAAERADIEVITFVSEPTAAFIAHATQLKSCRNVVVFDWGGGTLDVSVLERQGNSITERYTAGLQKAGDEIDYTLARWVHEQISEKHDVNLSFEGVKPTERQRLLNEAERVKLALQEDEVSEELVLLSVYAGIKYVEQPVSKEVFEELIGGLIKDAIDLLFRSIDEARISPIEIGKLLIVGGSSKLSLFQKELRRRWEFPNYIFPEGAEWDIARGAAYLAQNPGCYRTAESIGLELSDGMFYSVLPEETMVSESNRKIGLGLIEDTQTATFIFSARGEKSTDHRRIGELHAPCFGFRDETILLDCNITNDLTFEAKAESSHIRKNGSAPLYKYDKLHWKYDLKLEDN